MIKSLFKNIYFILLIIVTLLFSEILSQILVSGIGDILFPKNNVFNIFSYILFAILSLFIYFLIYKIICKKVYKTNFEWITLKPEIKNKYFIIPSIMVLLIIISYLFVNGYYISNNINSTKFAINISSTIFMGTITAPLLEEITFRGVILNLLGRHFNYKISIVLSGLLFGLMHLFNGVSNLTDALLLVASGTIMGSLLGIIAYLNKSIWASFVLHATFNLTTSVIPIGFHKINNWPFIYKMINHNKLISGGSTGFQSSVISMIIYVIIAIITIVIYKKSSKRYS